MAAMEGEMRETRSSSKRKKTSKLALTASAAPHPKPKWIPLADIDRSVSSTYGQGDDDLDLILIGTDVSQGDYTKKTDHYVGKHRWDASTRKAWIEELPTGIRYGGVKGVLLQFEANANFTAGGDRDFELPVGVRAPDECIYPSNVVHPGPGAAGAANRWGDAWPQAVVEVQFGSSVNQLAEKAYDWFHAATGIQLVIGIKIWKKIAGNVPMAAILFVRPAALPAGKKAVPTTTISFGTRALGGSSVTSVNNLGGPAIIGVGIGGAVACNAPGMALYQLPLPLARLFPAGIPGAFGAAVNFNIDLFLVQQTVIANYP